MLLMMIPHGELRFSFGIFETLQIALQFTVKSSRVRRWRPAVRFWTGTLFVRFIRVGRLTAFGLLARARAVSVSVGQLPTETETRLRAAHPIQSRCRICAKASPPPQPRKVANFAFSDARARAPKVHATRQITLCLQDDDSDVDEVASSRLAFMKPRDGRHHNFAVHSAAVTTCRARRRNGRMIKILFLKFGFAVGRRR